MKFKLRESMNKEIFYHLSPRRFDKFRSNDEGIHISDTKEGCIFVAENRGIDINDCYLYILSLSKPLNYIQIDLDPMGWRPDDIVRLFKAKITDSVVEGAFGDPDESGDNYKYDIPAEDVIHIDNLSQKDISFLDDIENRYVELKKNKSNDVQELRDKIFQEVSSFIDKKGFNSIRYPLAEDPSGRTFAYIILDPSMIIIDNVLEHQQILENIYTGDNNNKKNKRKYKKHSMSPFVSLDAGNVPYNIMMFNKMNGSHDSSDNFSETSAESISIGEALKILDEVDSHKPTYTYSYKGPVYRFEHLYTNLKEPIYTTAQNKKQAVTILKGKLKQKFGFEYNAKLDIDESRIQSDNKNEEKETKNNLYRKKVGSFQGKSIYLLKDGKYMLGNKKFNSSEQLRDYMEELWYD